VKFSEQVYAVVRWVPWGYVATYGQIARLLGQPHAARTVGWAMRGLSEGSDVPWHRVVNAAGRIIISDPQGAVEQRRLLEAEGVAFDACGRIDLERFGWVGPSELEIHFLLKEEGEQDGSAGSF
jgi:methylated-DNA-protein-cysteine methyltransferase-like protein